MKLKPILSYTLLILIFYSCKADVQKTESYAADENIVNEKPNVIIILTDDQGFNDLGCYGSEKIKTPNIDQMASEGLRLTNFYAQAVCGPSRAALMTGSYPIRVAEPNNIKRLHTVPHTDEITMAEVLKVAGYATGIIGKWHLAAEGNGPAGFDIETLPNAQGFDYFYGTPRFNGYTVFVEESDVRSPIMRNTDIIVNAVENWDNITQDYTKEAINYITENRDVPFFLYLAHNMPHIPLGASENFKGKSEYGPYGDAIEEIDWSTGKILETLKSLGIDNNTLVIYASDNGPWIETTVGMKSDGEAFIPAEHSGLADPLRGWKMASWEGGSRVPFIARWPSKIKPNRISDEILSTMDLLPTIAKFTKAEMPKKLVVDGYDSSSFLLGKDEKSPRDEYLYYCGNLLTGIRVNNWKLELPREKELKKLGWWARMLEEVENLELYDLEKDIGEKANVASQHPEVIAELLQRINLARKELGDLEIVGEGARFFDDGPRRLETDIERTK